MKQFSKLFLLALVLFVSIQTKTQSLNSFPILFWNVENLFDCKDNPLTQDEEFLPQSIRKWNYSKYRNKLNAVAKGIVNTGKWTLPVIVGLCEVENDSVLYDLTQRSNLKHLGYRFFITVPRDLRGINIGLLYLRERFKPISNRSIQVNKLKLTQHSTRDILHITGIVLSGDTLDLFVVHFPSRLGGVAFSEANRIEVAQQLKQVIQEVQDKRNSAKIIVMGDFNDTPQDKSVKYILDAKKPIEHPLPNQLYNLLANKGKQGTYKYKRAWSLIDQIIVTGNLLDPSSRFYTSESATTIVTDSFLFIPDEKYGGKKPLRTYQGLKYQGGFSDHLPVITVFTEIID